MRAIVRAGGVCCALAVTDVRETMRPLPIRVLRDAPPFVLGVGRIRGAAVPVVDLGALLTGSPSTRTTRFVTVRAGERLVALAVDEVLGLRDLGTEGSTPLPPLLTDAADRVEAVDHLDRELLLVLRRGLALPDLPADREEP